ncbi:MAG: DUF1257 domain-containing protein [Candidatus Aminicenantes bacterium]|nr:DUF1257 domain-containing protein [Candidatus Aminicenantes bacterium]NIM84242.1 DUF1257 domain-containing protein [Candidatus Aminicenantes bacterium]NIN23691.1 DUF1257 domain-containing protein [Candidatus Aminicenantes bacterium]NIN47398.1 DUF1257 domain-containing protein [Candidatus Aminicenantes bacterium]NIN90326.1 DUF1257 domain-containing protein [Candidatus Aminicenantes bacterium]
MSHFSTLKTRLLSGPYLVKALKDLGYAHVEVHETPQKLVGFFGFKTRKTAEIIIRKKHVTGLMGDVGFKKGNTGSYDLLVIQEDQEKLNDRWLGQLKQRYAYHVAMDTLINQGFFLAQESQEADQSIRLVLRRMT